MVAGEVTASGALPAETGVLAALAEERSRRQLGLEWLLVWIRRVGLVVLAFANTHTSTATIDPEPSSSAVAAAQAITCAAAFANAGFMLLLRSRATAARWLVRPSALLLDVVLLEATLFVVGRPLGQTWSVLILVPLEAGLEYLRVGSLGIGGLVAIGEVVREPSWSCTCPVGEDGEFCKHCVAVVLEVAGPERAPRQPTGQRDDGELDLRRYVAGLAPETLVELLLEQLESDWRLRERLMARAIATGGGAVDRRSWEERIDELFGDIRNFVPYAEAGGWAQDVFEVIDAVGDSVDAGYAAATVGSTIRTITQIRVPVRDPGPSSEDATPDRKALR